jgi:ketosteroid isomerase-like protein
MQTKHILIVSFFILAQALGACGVAGPAEADPVAVVQDFNAAVNAGDVDLAMTFVADDAVFINPNGTFDSPELIRKSIEDTISAGIIVELSNFRAESGKVMYDYIVTQGGSVLDQGTNGVTVVEDGRITFDGNEFSYPGP